MLFIHSVFLLCSFRAHILLQNSFAAFASVVGMFLCILPLLVGRIFFRNFEMPCFDCIAWLYFGIFLVSLLLLIFLLLISSNCIVIFAYCFILFFSSQHVPLFFFHSFVARFNTLSLSILFTKFPILVSFFCSGFFEEHRFYHRLILLLHKLARLIQWCCLLGYLVIIYLRGCFQ